MTTFHITAKTPEALRFIEYARTLPFVEEKKPKKSATAEVAAPDRIPGLAYTRQERIASVARAEEEFKATGVSFSQESMEIWASRLQ